MTAIGKSTMGYFLDFKLRLIINDMGEIINFVINPGNVDDIESLKIERFLEAIKGKLYGDKEYLSRELSKILFMDGIQRKLHYQSCIWGL